MQVQQLIVLCRPISRNGNGNQSHSHSVVKDYDPVLVEGAFTRHPAQIALAPPPPPFTHAFSRVDRMSTAVVSKPSPISKLPYDPLWSIFSEIANMDEDIDLNFAVEEGEGGYLWELRALNNLRRSSQVCKSWRAIILDSSTLWGRVVDFDCLDQSTDDWRDEVIRRTGQALIIMKGKINGDDETICTAFSSIVTANWDRIQELDVGVYAASEFACRRVIAWNFIARPAKHLRFFRLDLAPPACWVRLSDPTPFSGDMPLLRVFATQSVSCPLQGPWLSHLRHLAIASPSPRPLHTVRHLLDVLRAMPSLETLGLIDAIADIVPENLDAISLPRLRQLTIRDRILICGKVLNEITPADGCCLFMDTVDDAQAIASWHHLDFMQYLIFQWSSRYFKKHLPQRLQIQRKGGVFKIIELPFKSPSDSTQFYTSIRPTRTRNVTALHYFGGLDPLLFTTLTFLNISCSLFDTHPDDSNFETFLFSLSSLEVLATTFETLRFVLNKVPHSRNGSILFPSLQTLAIRGMGRETAVSLDLSQPFLVFLNWRNQVQVPLEILDPTKCGDLIPKMPFLDGFGGLKVVWSKRDGLGDTESYVCGSGDPDILNFFDLSYLDSAIDDILSSQ